ncbi:HK97 gp10 family phage protein [Cytobacillus horneckiae]|uniref:HK97 gp10 family phage protein n=1 Tax=Cytobacillus horneckiae TaxID=549687 RepID=UPI0039A30743
MPNISDLTDEIMRQLRMYEHDVSEKVDEAKKEVSEEAVSKLRQLSPKGATGNYRKGWRVKKVGNKFVVHNATNYQLTHLLEKGHAKVGGGRVAPRVHIRPVEEKAIDDFLERVERAIRG